MRKRLITGGCSFTQYCWNTWADYLGKHYESFVQAGKCAIDNATVARRIIDVAEPGDDVVILWTGMDRWAPRKDGEWLYRGCVASHKEYFTKYYDPVERFMTSMDYVRMVDMHSRQNNYNVWHFTAYPWYLGEIEKTVLPEILEIHSSYNIPKFYIENDLESFRNSMGTVWTFHKYTNGDNHPTPWHHWCWLKEIVAPNIGLVIDNSIENQVKFDNDRVLKGDVD